MAFWREKGGALKSRRSCDSWGGGQQQAGVARGEAVGTHLLTVSSMGPAIPAWGCPQCRSQGLLISAGWTGLRRAPCPILGKSLWVSPNSLNSETWNSPAQAPYKVNREENTSVGQLRLLRSKSGYACFSLCPIESEATALLRWVA